MPTASNRPPCCRCCTPFRTSWVTFLLQWSLRSPAASVAIDAELYANVDSKGGRLAFGPLATADVPALLDALVDEVPASHSRYMGPVAEIPYLQRQQRLTFARAGVGDPLCLDTYQALGGFRGLKRALAMTGQQIVDEMKASGLRGRGGAAFPAGIKWQTVLDTAGDEKYIVCNADEGDSGTFADRLLMEADPCQLIEGVVRAKPPLPAIEGLFGKPTVVNNVLTLAAVTTILAEGADFYHDYGMGRSRGTLPFQLAGNIRRGGLVEVAFGDTLRDLVEQYGGGTASGRPVKAIQVGGPLGAYLPESQWDLPMDYEGFAANSAMLGHGGVVVFDDSVDMGEQARFAMEFCAEESCGKCTPCRIGSVRGVEVIDRIRILSGTRPTPRSAPRSTPASRHRI